MSDLRSNEKLFSEIMQKSKLDMPFSDFEDNVMHRITKEAGVKETISKNLKLSILFFLLGTALGMLIGNFLSQSMHTLFNIPKDKVHLLFQIVYILFFLTQLDTIIKLWIKLR